MSLETAATIDQLVITNPTSTDPLAEADDHIRMLKTALKATFPGITGTTTATTAALNALAVALTDIATLKTSTFPVSGGMVYGNATATGYVNAAALLVGGFALVPRGIVSMWSGSVANIPSGWALCNGLLGTPDLRDRFILGAGGATPPYGFGGALTDTATTSAVAAHSHGQATGVAGAHTHSGTSDTAGNHNHGGTQGHALTIDEMPAHTHLFPSGASGSGGALAGAASSTQATQSTGSGNSHAHGITFDGAHAHNLAIGSVGDHGHAIGPDGSHAHTVSVTIVPPFIALAFIMKL